MLSALWKPAHGISSSSVPNRCDDILRSWCWLHLGRSEETTECLCLLSNAARRRKGLSSLSLSHKHTHDNKSEALGAPQVAALAHPSHAQDSVHASSVISDLFDRGTLLQRPYHTHATSMPPQACFKHAWHGKSGASTSLPPLDPPAAPLAAPAPPALAPLAALDPVAHCNSLKCVRQILSTTHRLRTLFSTPDPISDRPQLPTLASGVTIGSSGA